MSSNSRVLVRAINAFHNCVMVGMGKESHGLSYSTLSRLILRNQHFVGLILLYGIAGTQFSVCVCGVYICVCVVCACVVEHDMCVCVSVCVCVCVKTAQHCVCKALCHSVC